MSLGVRSLVLTRLSDSHYNRTESFLMHIKHSTHFSFLLVSLWIANFTSAAVFAQAAPSNCGELRLHRTGQFGPYDYRTDKSKLGIVEDYHFTPAVEALVRGATTVLPGSDLDYTLRAFPNHPRALLAMVRYGEKMKSPQPSGAHYSVECYFDRALRFRPNDSIVRMIYANYLSKSTRTPEAIQQLEQATASAGDNAFSHYNIGLIYFDLKAYDRALVQAHKAIALGFSQTALRDQLQGVGKWTEPEASPTPDASQK
jgi:tetratricopeptide (TPR) repeat protein